MNYYYTISKKFLRNFHSNLNQEQAYRVFSFFKDNFFSNDKYRARLKNFSEFVQKNLSKQLCERFQEFVRRFFACSDWFCPTLYCPTLYTPQCMKFRLENQISSLNKFKMTGFFLLGSDFCARIGGKLRTIFQKIFLSGYY